MPQTPRIPSPSRVGLLAACASMVLLAGCQGGTPGGATPQNLPQISLPSMEKVTAYVDAGTTAGSQRLAERVRDALLGEPRLAGASLGVQGFEGGLIVLSGSLPSAAARPDALQTARSVNGVREVVDRMTAP